MWERSKILKVHEQLKSVQYWLTYFPFAVLTVVSKLIGVQESELTEALLHKKMNTPDGVILTPLSKEQVKKVDSLIHCLS